MIADTIRLHGWRSTGPSDGRHRPRGWVAAALVFFVANGLTPYLGTQMQHAGAMLSNLRIDAGCWNHLLVPESVRRVDAYIRVDVASIGNAESETLGAFPGGEAILRERLWSTTALRLMRRNWCTDRTRPISLSGTFLGEPLVIRDLCDPAEPLPVGPGVWGLTEFFPDYLRLQKNLERACPQECLH